MGDFGHLPDDLIVRTLRATACGTQIARAAGVNSSWRRAAQQPELWAERASTDLTVAQELLGSRHPKDTYVEALTAESWVWGLLPHGGPCPLPGGDSCASSLMAHTASGSRAAAPTKLTYIPSAYAAAGGSPERAVNEQEGQGQQFEAASMQYLSAGSSVTLQRRQTGNGGTNSSNSSGGGVDAQESSSGTSVLAPRASPVAVAAGEDFVVLCTAAGGVWDSRHAAKHRHPGVQVRDVGSALTGHVVKQIAAGQYHVLALTAGGIVFGWGANSCGQLGLGESSAWVREPAVVTSELQKEREACSSDERVCAVAAGMEHSGLLTARGSVFLAGRNAAGECACATAGAAHCVESWTAVELPDGAGPAAQLALGGRNTVVVTTSGRVLVCGCNASGQCSPGGVTPPAPGSWADVGPDCRWHGMARKGQDPCGGGGAAADAAVAAAIGRGAIYALTASGDVYHWGAHPATGRPNSAPAKVQGIQGAVSLAASSAGRFAAAIDASGRILTWGAGKAGQLGHGGAGGKSAVAREVKALRGRRVVAAACGTDCMVAITAWAPPRRHGSYNPTLGGRTAATPISSPTPTASGLSGRDACGGEGASSPSPRGADRDGATSGQQLPRSRSANRTLTPQAGGGSAVGTRTEVADAGTDCEPRAGGSGGDSRWRGAAAARASRGAADTRRPTTRSPSTGPSPTAVAATAGSSGDEGGEIGGWRTEPLDRAGRVAVRRTLRAFAHDPRARELQMPTGLSAADRQSIHLMAEGWGLAHASYGEGDLRTLRIWKASRTRAWGAPVVPPSRMEGGGSGGAAGGQGGGGV